MDETPTQEPHSCPDRLRAFGCGFYSYKSINVASKQLEFYEVDEYALVPVVIAGRVIPHANGYRSSHMRLLGDKYPFAMSVQEAYAKAESLGIKVDEHADVTVEQLKLNQRLSIKSYGEYLGF